jgi:hypothetical protein
MDQGGSPPAQRSIEPEQVPPLEAGLTVEQARMTPWPFSRGKGRPMGELMDAGRLTLKDLVYAIENAWDERVRRAAAVLLALSLNQVVKEPSPPAGPLKVVSGGRSFAQRKEIETIMWWSLVAGILFGASMVGFIWDWTIRTPQMRMEVLRKAMESPLGIVSTVIVLFLLAIATWGAARLLGKLASKQINKAIETYRKGQEGEEEFVETMRRNLDGHWTLFRNVRLPGSKGDIDAILVGPPGVWVLEVKTFSGEYQNIGEHWMHRAGRRWKVLRKSPSRQAKTHAVQLHHFLKRQGIHQWVEPVVVWASREGTVKVESPAVPVWKIDHLPEELGNIWQGQTISDEIRTRIEEKLTALYKSGPKNSTGLEPAP